MKRSKIIILIFFVLAIIGLGIFQYFSSFRSVIITIKGPEINLLQGERIVQTINETATLSLRDGSYCMTPTDKKYADEKKCFTVYKKDLTITSDPYYSKEHLATLQAAEQGLLTKTISETYPTIIGNYTICEGSLLKKGEWYVATVMQKSLSVSDNNDLYKTVLQKIDGVWKVVARPSIVLSKFSYPNIPHNVLSLANEEGGCKPDGYLSQPLPDNSVYPVPVKFD